MQEASQREKSVAGNGAHVRDGNHSMDALDLNLQPSAFPHLASYQAYLESDVVASRRGGRHGANSTRSGRGSVLPQVASVGDGLAKTANATTFRPPRMTRGRGQAGRGRSRSTGSVARSAQQAPGAATEPEGISPPQIAAPTRGSQFPAPSKSVGAPSGNMSGASVPANEDNDLEDQDESIGQGPMMNFPSTHEKDKKLEMILKHQRAKHRLGMVACMIGSYYYASYMNKSKRRKIDMSGYEWVMNTLNSPRACYNMFRMSRELIASLHNLLVSSYDLKGTKKMSSVEALCMFLWMVGAPQSVRQADNRFERSIGTVSKKFDEVLQSLFMLSADIIKPKDPKFTTVHPRLEGPRFSPYFDNCIGAIDGTHVHVVVPASKVIQHVGRHGYSTQNVLAICDFDMRFTFVVAGWPGSVHDMRVFKDAITKYGDKFLHPPPGKFYLVDSGYPNRPGYLAPYKSTKYHIPDFKQEPRPSGKKEVFNFLHSSLRNVIERSFGVLKLKWRILLDLPSYPMVKQSKIILACMALHNFIRESAMADKDFDMCDNDENYMPMPAESSSQRSSGNRHLRDEDEDMNSFRDHLANSLFARGDRL